MKTIFVALAVALITVMPSAAALPADNYVWQDASSGSIMSSSSSSYIMGYRFSPHDDMYVTELCRYTGSTNTVKIYDSSFNELRALSIGGGVGWSCAELASPLQVLSTEDYYVVVCSEGNDWYYESGISLPQNINNVDVYETVWQSSSGCTFNAPSAYSSTMYGLADIGVVASIDSNPPSVTNIQSSPPNPNPSEDVTITALSLIHI